jgi:hypothetical protein
MNVLPREKQIEVIAALCEGVGIRTASRLTGVNRGTAPTWPSASGLAAWNCTTGSWSASAPSG